MTTRSSNQADRDGTEHDVGAEKPQNLGSWPNMALKGDMPMAEWCEVLYQNCASGIQKLQRFGHAWTKHRKYVSMH